MTERILPQHAAGGLANGLVPLATRGSNTFAQDLQDEALAGDIILANFVGAVVFFMVLLQVIQLTRIHVISLPPRFYHSEHVV